MMKKVLGATIFLALLIVAGSIINSLRASQIIGNNYRYNLVLAAPDEPVIFASFDPQEKQVFTISYPTELEIKSRSVGTYTIGNLYKLGEYEGAPENLVRRKVQGFMRVPVQGFVGYKALTNKMADKEIVLNSLMRNWIRHDQPTTLGRLDSLVLYIKAKQFDWQISGVDELVRAGVIVKKDNVYASVQERLKQFLGTKVFDWELGSKSPTVVIINESSEDGLGGEMAEFLGNLGFDIVAVKSTQEQRELTIVEYTADAENPKEIGKVMKNLFGWVNMTESNSQEYRAQYVVRLGKDTIQLF